MVDLIWGFLDGSDGNEYACSAGDPDSVPGSGRSPGEGNGYPLQYSCLKNYGAENHNTEQEAVTKIILKKKKCMKAEWLSKEAL